MTRLRYEGLGLADHPRSLTLPSTPTQEGLAVTALIEQVDIHVTPPGAASLYPSPADSPAPRGRRPGDLLSDHMVDRLPEPMRTLVRERLAGRREQVRVRLVQWPTEVVIENRPQEPL